MTGDNLKELNEALDELTKGKPYIKIRAFNATYEDGIELRLEYKMYGVEFFSAKEMMATRSSPSGFLEELVARLQNLEFRMFEQLRSDRKDKPL